MANKHMKRCPTSYDIRKMQIKTTVRYHYTSIRMYKIQKTANTKCWQGCRVAGALINCWWKCKMVQSLWKTVWQCLTKLKILLPYDPPITLRGIYSKELKTYVHTKIYMGMFTAALFTIAKTWKQPTCHR